MSETFTKLFHSITESTIWSEDNETRIVWITMLALADQYGYVGASVPGLASRANVTVAATRKALKKFLSPDLDSRSPEYEGRRIEVTDRGWNVLNYQRFRDMRDEDVRKQYERDRKREQRAKSRVPDSPAMSQHVPLCPAVSAQAEAEVEVDTEAVDQELDQDHRADARKSHKVLVKIAHQAIDASDSESEARALMKDLAAKARIAYNSTEVNMAMDVALNQRMNNGE